MSNDTETTEEAPPAEEKKRFTLPSAYTILFMLIVLAAAATWIIPAGQYDLDEEGSPIPGTYEEIDSNPQRIVVDSLEAPINGLYGIEDGDRQHRLLQQRRTVRRDRRRSVHPRHRRLHRHHDEDGCHPGRHRAARAAHARQGALDDPDPDDGLRHRWHHVRHGRGEPRLLRADHHGDDRRRVRRHGRRRS